MSKLAGESESNLRKGLSKLKESWQGVMQFFRGVAQSIVL